MALGLGLGIFVAPVAAVAADASPAIANPAGGPRVTVDTVRRRELIDRVIVTGTLVPRDEILVGPEVDGYRIIQILAEDGDRVAKGQVLARLDRNTLEAVLAQNDATLARLDALIAQAKSQIAQAEVSLTQTRQALGRTSHLKESGYASQAILETQTNDERSARARLDAARQGLTSAEADKASAQAQRREIELRLSRTEVKAPAAGIVSRRTAKIGAVAAMAAEPLFRLIADGDIELEAEVPEIRTHEVKAGNAAVVSVGEIKANAKVRLVSSEIDKTTRLGKVRIAISDDKNLRVGAFGRGIIDTRRSTGVAVPLSAVLYGPNGPFVQVVKDGHIVSTGVALGIVADQQVEILKGLNESQTFVVKAGAFLRDGDAVTPIPLDARKTGSQ